MYQTYRHPFPFHPLGRGERKDPFDLLPYRRYGRGHPDKGLAVAKSEALCC